MSTTFSVFPSNAYMPAFGEVIEAAEEKLRCYLREMGIVLDIRLEVALLSKEGDHNTFVSLDDEMIWDDDHYAWFYAGGMKD